MAMGEANAQTSMSDDFGQRKIGGIDVKVALDELKIGGNLSEEFKGIAIRKVAETQNLADFAWREEFFELRMNVNCDREPAIFIRTYSCGNILQWREHGAFRLASF